MKRLALFVLAAAIPVGTALAQEEAGSTTEKLPQASASAEASVAPLPAPSTTHGAHTGANSPQGAGAEAGSGGGMAGSGGGQTGPAAAPTSPGPEGKLTVDAGEIAFDIPNAWKSVPPASMMRKAQVAIPKAEGDPEDAEISISFFPGGGGGVDANVSRWLGQFETADGKPVNDTAKKEQLKAGALEVTLVDIAGTMKASGMPGMGPTEDKKNWHMLGGIVVTPAGPWFFKATGPEKTVVAQRDAFKALLSSVKTK